MPQFGDAFFVNAKKEEIGLAGARADFDVGAVAGADRESAIERKFHIAGAGGFHAGD